MAVESDGDDCPYVRGPVHGNVKDTATFETKPSVIYSDGSRDSGGGYERWRSTEYREHTPGDRREDVYVYHHRLLAIVACYPLDMPLPEILEDMRGSDVHHESEEHDRGVEWDNRPETLSVVDHGDHASITASAPSRTELRAWHEDAKREQQAQQGPPRCPRCREESDLWFEHEESGKVVCVDCSFDIGGSFTEADAPDAGVVA